MRINILLFIVYFSLLSSIAFCQSKIENEICLDGSKILMIGMDNPIVFCNSDKIPLKKEDITVEFIHSMSKNKTKLLIHENNFGIYVRPDSLGFVKIRVKTSQGLNKTFDLKTKFLTAYGTYLNYHSYHDEPIGAEEFRLGLGINIHPEFDGKCIIESFEIIRIDSLGRANKVINEGDKFSSLSLEIINKATVGDLYIFRKIYYKSPGSYFSLLMDDMSFEIN